MTLVLIIDYADGDHDWMDPRGGDESLKRLQESGNHNAKMYIIKNAGHHGKSKAFILYASLIDSFLPIVYLDNPEAVNALLTKELTVKN